MAVILGSFFFGLSVLAHRIKPTASEHETILSILGRAVFGDGSAMYYVLQFSTFAILILAANTAFSGFPLLSQLVARDGYLPTPTRDTAATGSCSRTASSCWPVSRGCS